MNGKRLSSFVVACALSVGVAQAQTAPGTSPAPRGPMMQRPAFSAAFPLRMAYRTIGMAEARGAGGRYLDAARTHYRSALARFERSDQRAAASEAMAAGALARAAIDERPPVTPRDLPTPPPLPTPGAGAPGRRFIMRAPAGAPGGASGPQIAGAAPIPGRPGAGPGPGGRMHFAPRFRGRGHGFGRGRRRGHGRFDPAALARYAKLENTAEANDLARSALDADIARERALFAGNRDEATRQGRLARDLAAAVRALAMADHPPQFPRPRMMRRPLQVPGGGFNPGGPMRPAPPSGMPPT